MDVATLANFLLFFGAFAASFATADSGSGTSGDTANPGDDLYNSADYARTDHYGDGNDTVSADADNLAWFMGGGDDSLTGSSAADYADLGSGNDHAEMGAGDDKAEAGDGADSVLGGTGNDLVFGGAGADNLFGDLGNDSLSGDAGNDFIAGGAGADLLAGGDGNDVISGFAFSGGAAPGMTAPDGADQLFGGAGDDQLILGRGDRATGGAGADSFEMDARWGDGSAAFTISDYQQGEDRLVLHYAPQPDPDSSDTTTPEISVQLSADGQSSLVLMNGTVIAMVEGVNDLTLADITLHLDRETDLGYVPSSFANTLSATDGADTAHGTDAADYGRMGAGDDRVDAGGGADSILGEGGDDWLDGGAGNDTLLAGDGNDVVTGGAGTDIVLGEHGEDKLSGGDGSDWIWGGGGNDTLSGFDATSPGVGGTASAIDGTDALFGGDGADTLILGKGDAGTGGDGNDIFWLNPDANADAAAIVTVQDYTAGQDRIELHYTPVFDANGADIVPTVTILRGPSDAYGVITFNGEAIAHIIGVPDLAMADIILMREE